MHERVKTHTVLPGLKMKNNMPATAHCKGNIKWIRSKEVSGAAGSADTKKREHVYLGRLSLLDEVDSMEASTVSES